MSLLPIGKFAKRAGVHPETLKRLERDNKLIPAYKSDAGTRYYAPSQLSYFKGTSSTGEPKLTIGYCRVSNRNLQDDLDAQVASVKSYMLSKGYQFDIITDIGSGLNYSKKGLLKLIELINNREIDRVVVLYKDRLIRLGFELLEYLCQLNAVELVVIDHSEKSREDELIEDLSQIITNMYGSSSKRAKDLLKLVKNNDASQED